MLVATYGHLGRQEDAPSVITKFNTLRKKSGRPSISLRLVQGWSFKSQQDKEKVIEGLRLANVPEVPDDYNLRLQDRLKGHELRALLFGSWNYGGNPLLFLLIVIVR